MGGIRFYDELTRNIETTIINTESMTVEEKEYTVSQKIISSNGVSTTVTSDTVTFQGVTLKTPPAGFPNPLPKESYQLFINGVIVESVAVSSISEVGGNLVVVFDTVELNYELDPNDEYSIIGKFN